MRVTGEPGCTLARAHIYQELQDIVQLCPECSPREAISACRSKTKSGAPAGCLLTKRQPGRYSLAGPGLPVRVGCCIVAFSSFE
jgi:hypothetical protein